VARTTKPVCFLGTSKDRLSAVLLALSLTVINQAEAQLRVMSQSVFVELSLDRKRPAQSALLARSRADPHHVCWKSCDVLSCEEFW